jgi:hypothetical protein
MASYMRSQDGQSLTQSLFFEDTQADLHFQDLSQVLLRFLLASAGLFADAKHCTCRTPSPRFGQVKRTPSPQRRQLPCQQTLALLSATLQPSLSKRSGC